MEEKNKGGRPLLTQEQKAQRKTDLLQKLEPYLKSGLSVNKTLKEAKVFNSEFYKYMAEDELFRREIERFKQYISILVNYALVHELMTIVDKQNHNEPLLKEDVKFLWWFALNSNLCREEWGRRDNINLSFDPEEAIQRVRTLIEESSTQEILHN